MTHIIGRISGELKGTNQYVCTLYEMDGTVWTLCGVMAKEEWEGESNGVWECTSGKLRRLLIEEYVRYQNVTRKMRFWLDLAHERDREEVLSAVLYGDLMRRVGLDSSYSEQEERVKERWRRRGRRLLSLMAAKL